MFLMEHLRDFPEKPVDRIEHQYHIIIPKYDNSFHKLKPEKLAEYLEELSERFGGTTIIPCAGTYIGKDGKLYIDESVLVICQRIFSKNTSIEEAKRITEEDKEFLMEFSHKVGVDLGQESIFIAILPSNGELITGEQRSSAKPEFIGTNWLSKYL